MKKSVLALVIAGTLIGGSSAGFAASPTPMAKPSKPVAGTTTQKSDAMTTTKPATTVKPAKTKKAKTTAKPMATTTPAKK
jgi:hypothetical protein